MKLKCHSFFTQQRFVEGSFFAPSTARHWGYETKLDTRGSHSLVVNMKPWLSVWWIRKHAVRVWHWLLMQSQIRAGYSRKGWLSWNQRAEESAKPAVRKREQHRGMPQVADAQQGLETVEDMRLAALAGPCLNALHTMIRVYDHGSGEVAEEDQGYRMDFVFIIRPSGCCGKQRAKINIPESSGRVLVSRWPQPKRRERSQQNREMFLRSYSLDLFRS